jgi:hypothetical protein
MNRKGEVFNLTFKELNEKVNAEHIGGFTNPKQKRITLSWEGINFTYCEKGKISNATFEILAKYGLEPTIFNCCNLELWGYVHLPEYYKDVVLKHGGVMR